MPPHVVRIVAPGAFASTLAGTFAIFREVVDAARVMTRAPHDFIRVGAPEEGRPLEGSVRLRQTLPDRELCEASRRAQRRPVDEVGSEFEASAGLVMHQVAPS